MNPWLHCFVKWISSICLLGMGAWTSLAVFYSPLPPPLRPWLAGVYGIGILLAFVGGFSTPRTQLAGLAVCVSVLAWWLHMQPSNKRNWQPDVALLPSVEFLGQQVTIRNIRNCDYRSEQDYTVHYYDRTFGLESLKSVDLCLVYWGFPAIAHTMLSFGFEGNNYVCFSVEARKEIGEEYSNIKGFFRKYELTYVIADERDLIGLRTNYRGEQVYLYRLTESAELAQKIFVDYLRQVNSLKDHPEWYNALTGNCTTSFRINKAPYNPDARLDWRIIANGYIDEMLYERKLIDTSLPFPELKQRSLINGRALGHDKSPGFSRLIRAGLPGMEQGQ